MFEETLSREIGGNNLQQWLLAASVAAAVFVALSIARMLVRRRVARTARSLEQGKQHRHEQVTEVRHAIFAALARTRMWFFLAIGTFAAEPLLSLETEVTSWVNRVLVGLLLVQVGIWGSVLISRAVQRRFDVEPDEDPSRTSAATVVRILGLLLLWSVILLSILANAGVNITALVAGLGVGGIAVALALQNVLGDLFAAVSILLDKPFAVGDFVIVGESLGTVEKIGLKTTRIRSLSGEQLVFANNDLLISRIRNFKKMRERRVMFRLNVVYETPTTKVERIPEILRKQIEGREDVRFDRAHFASYGEYALVFEVVYWVLSPDYTLYMDRQQEINLGILHAFEAEGIQLALPTRTLHAPALEQRWRKTG